MGYIISIANQKGGVGKTTTAVNLSASLAVVEKSCLLVDCDPQGNATTGLGIEKSSIKHGLYDFMLGSAHEKEVIIESGLSGLHLIGSTANLIGAEVEMVSADAREYRLRKKIMPLKDRYDYIFIVNFHNYFSSYSFFSISYIIFRFVCIVFNFYFNFDFFFICYFFICYS